MKLWTLLAGLIASASVAYQFSLNVSWFRNLGKALRVRLRPGPRSDLKFITKL